MDWRKFPDELPTDGQHIHVTDGVDIVTACFNMSDYKEYPDDVMMFLHGVGFFAWNWEWDFETITHWKPLIDLPGVVKTT